MNKFKNIYFYILMLVVVFSALQFSLLTNGLHSILASTNAKASTSEWVGGVGFKPDRIEISSVGINLPIVSVPLINGTWEVHDKTANFAEGTSYINSQKGNVGIFAHDREDGFVRIKNLKAGDEIIVSGGGFKASYKVITSNIVQINQVDVFYPTQTPQLTLITCEGLLSERRYQVIASLEKIEPLEGVLR